MSGKRKGPQFTLHGKAFDPVERKAPESEARVIAMLEALPDGALLDTEEVCGRTGFGRMTLFSTVRSGHLDIYRLKLDSRKVYFGNRRTIALARKELAHRENS